MPSVSFPKQKLAEGVRTKLVMAKKRSHDQAVEDTRAPTKKLKSSSVSNPALQPRIRDNGYEQETFQSHGTFKLQNYLVGGRVQDTYCQQVLQSM